MANGLCQGICHAGLSHADGCTLRYGGTGSEAGSGARVLEPRSLEKEAVAVGLPCEARSERQVTDPLGPGGHRAFLQEASGSGTSTVNKASLNPRRVPSAICDTVDGLNKRVSSHTCTE